MTSGGVASKSFLEENCDQGFEGSTSKNCTHNCPIAMQRARIDSESPLGIKQQRDRPIVDHFNIHHRSKFSCFNFNSKTLE